MKIHRFFVAADLPMSGEIELADTELAHQLRHVLRFQVGHQLVLFNNSGREFCAHIVRLSNRLVTFEIDAVKDGKLRNEKLRKAESRDGKPSHESTLRIFMALSKRPAFEMALEKGTELGVDIFTPVLSERSEKKSLNAERSFRIVREAAEQCGRTTLPQITEPIVFEELLKICAESKKAALENIIILHPEAERLDIQKILQMKQAVRQADDAPAREISLCIGPEGGWSPKEIQAFQALQMPIFSVSENILRFETAVIVGTVLMLSSV